MYSSTIINVSILTFLVAIIPKAKYMFGLYPHIHHHQVRNVMDDIFLWSKVKRILGFN